jgi:hypothetical protein
MAFGLALAGCGLAAAGAQADGLYVLGGIGVRGLSDQDFNDFYQTDSYSYDDNGAGALDAGLSLGYRFPGIMALELSANMVGDRSASVSEWGSDFSGNDSWVTDSLQVNATPVFGFGPVFCWDGRNWWFGRHMTTELGLRVEYANISGSETLVDDTGTSTQDFNGDTVGFGLFLRMLNVWDSSGINMGLELGGDYLRCDSLTTSNRTGELADISSSSLTNWNNSNAYIDESGVWLRFVFGWSQPTSAEPGSTVPRRRARRAVRYEDPELGD